MKALVLLGGAALLGIGLCVYKQQTGDSSAVGAGQVATPSGVSPNLNATSPSSPAPKSAAGMGKTIAFQSTAALAPNATMTQPGFLPQGRYLFGKAV